MADTEVAEVTDAPAVADEESVGTILKIPVKGGGMVEINTRELPNNVYAAALALGLKDLANRGMTKITTKGLEGDELAKAKAAAQAKAEKNVADLKAGKLPRIAGQKADSGKIPGVVMTEARRLARNLIKDEIKASGGKVSHYSAKEITEAANAYLASEEGKSLIEEAKQAVAKRTETVLGGKTEDEAAAASKAKLANLGLKADPKKVAKAEEAAKAKKEAKEKTDAVLSAARAGQVKSRTPKGAPARA